jgi:WD40 repeat protein
MGGQLRVIAGDGTGDGMLRQLVGSTPPAWRPGGDRELTFSTVDGRIELVETDSTKTRWRTGPGEVPTQLVWSEDGQRLLVLSDRSLRVLDANGRRLWAIRLPIGPSGVVFVRQSHRFVMIRYSAATGRSDLVLLQAETNPGEARFLYSAPGDFGSLAVSPNGKWLLVGWVNADQWLFLRLTAAKVTAVSNIAEQFGAGQRVGPLSEAFPASVSWCCPPSP